MDQSPENTRFYTPDQIPQNVFDHNLERVRNKIGEIVVCDSDGNELLDNPFENLQSTIVVSNHRYIVLDPLVFMSLSSSSDDVNSIIRPVIGDNLMPENKSLNYALYLLFTKLGGAIANSRNIQDLFMSTGAIKIMRSGKDMTVSQRKKLREIFLGDLSEIMQTGGNTWVSGSPGRTPIGASNIELRNIEHLASRGVKFNILPAHIAYGNDTIYPEDRSYRRSKQWYHDPYDIGRELWASSPSPTIFVGESRPFSEYTEKELTDIILKQHV